MHDNSACCARPSLRERPLLSVEQASDLENMFKVLANDTRLRILHALIKGSEMCVTDIANLLEMKPQAISNQLQRLADLRIIDSRRDGNNVYYRVVDPCIVSLLDLGICLTEERAAQNAAAERG